MLINLPENLLSNPNVKEAVAVIHAALAEAGAGIDAKRKERAERKEREMALREQNRLDRNARNEQKEQDRAKREAARSQREAEKLQKAKERIEKQVARDKEKAEKEEARYIKSRSVGTAAKIDLFIQQQCELNPASETSWKLFHECFGQHAEYKVPTALAIQLALPREIKFVDGYVKGLRPNAALRTQFECIQTERDKASP